MRRLGLALIVLASVFSSDSAGAESGKACLTAPIGLNAFKAGHCFAANETEALWTARIDGENGAPISKVFGKALDGQPKTLETCSDVQDLDVESHDRLEVSTDTDLQRVRRSCDAVAYFGIGQPWETTNLRGPGVDLADVAVVSVSVLPDGLSLPEDWTGGETLQTAEKAGKVKVIKAPGAALILEYEGKRYAFGEAGRADFSGDGAEDMLVMVEEILKTGARRHAYALGLTREGTGPLTRIDENTE